MNKTFIQDKLKAIQTKTLPLQKKAKELIESAKEQLGAEQSVIGVDIGYSSIKVVQMANVNGVMSVIKLKFVPISGRLGNEEEVLASLKLALVGMDTKGARVIALINCPETCTRRIIAPNMPKKELAEAIRWEAKNAIPFSIDHALIDYEIIGDVTENNTKKLIVAVSASPKETVNRYVSLFTKAGLELSAMIPMSLCLQNWISHSKEMRVLNIAIIELGASIAELNIFEKGKLSFSRKLPITGGDITKAMTSTLMSGEGKIELTTEEAEKIKKAHGIPIGEENEKIDGKILPSQIVSLIRPCVEQLAGEIERSFDYYREQSHGEKVDEILLFGGGANLKGLVGYLNNELEMKIDIGNAFADVAGNINLENQKDHESSRFDLAVGAILKKDVKINLLPEQYKGKTKQFIEHLSIQAVATGVATTLLLSLIGLNVQHAAQNKKLAALRLEQKVLIPQTESLRVMFIANQIRGIHPAWEDVLKEISNTMQPKMYLTNLSMEEDIVSIQGVINQVGQNAQAILSNFMIILEEGIFKDVSLVTSRRGSNGEPIFEFEISAEVE